MPTAVSATRDFVLGIDFGGTKIAIATATLDGELMESDRLETDAAGGAIQAVERAFVRADELAAAAAENGDGRCVAVSAVSPGIVFEDHVALAPNVPGWQELKLPALLRERFAPARSAVGTDVKAAAVAELRWGSLRGADPAILLILGTGIAAAIVIDGEVLAGRERRGRRDRLQPAATAPTTAARRTAALRSRSSPAGARSASGRAGCLARRSRPPRSSSIRTRGRASCSTRRSMPWPSRWPTWRFWWTRLASRSAAG